MSLIRRDASAHAPTASSSSSSSSSSSIRAASSSYSSLFSSPSYATRQLLTRTLGVTLTIGALSTLFLAFREWRRRRAARCAGVDEHSMPLPLNYKPSFSYESHDLLVLFPSTVAAEREKHYAVMHAESLPGAEANLMSPSDAQKKACTYGLDDSETELIDSLRLLHPRSIQFLHVSLETYLGLFTGWTQQRKADTLILNLCDGTELDGIPGLSVLRHLHASGMAYTGADENFFVLSTYKVRMKKRFNEYGVATAKWANLDAQAVKEWRSWREQEGPTAADNALSSPTASPTSSSSSPSLSASASQDDLPAHALHRHPSPFVEQFSPLLESTLATLSTMPYPLLVKPDDSYCSCGITTRSVVFSPEQAMDYAAEIAPEFSGIFVEQFIRGREFTVFISGDARKVNIASNETRSMRSGSVTSAFEDLSHITLDSETVKDIRVLAPVERVFDSSLPFYEQFISYELFWEIARANQGKDEFVFKGVPSTDSLQVTDAEGRVTSISLIRALKEEALRAYIAVGGCGYARVDIRYDSTTHKIAVLEVNANCGITQYRQTAMGEILRESHTNFVDVLDAFFYDARRGRDARKNSK